jgi:SAM-dependent methyltransferase
VPTAEFDSHADSYREAVEESIGFSGIELDFFARRKADLLLDVVARRVGDPAGLTLLDVGCGIGVTDRFLVDRVGRMLGVDMSHEAVARAREANPGVSYQAYEGEVLPYEDECVDVAFAICVMHHVPPAGRPGLALELRRVVRRGGLAVIFEHNPFNPFTRLAVSRCEFDEDAILLTRRESSHVLAGAGLEPVEARYVVFFTAEGPRLAAAERLLRWLPAGAQHYVAARR